MKDTLTDTEPPRFPCAPKATALAAAILAEHPDMRNWWALQDATVVPRAQAVREFADEPDPYLRGGYIARRVLELVPVRIRPAQLFAVGTAVYADSAEARQEAYAYLGTQPPLRGHSHHISMDYEKLIRLGVSGIRAEIDAAEAEHPDRHTFYESLRLALEGLCIYARRHRDEALRLRDAEPDPARRAELQATADALARVPEAPAETLLEAIHAALLLHVASRTMEADSAIGRMDHYLDPYYRRDMAAGRITQEQAAHWMHNALAHLLEVTRFSDSLVLAGCEADGVTPFWGDLTYFLLDAVAALKLPNPQVGFRYCPGQPRALLRRAFACVTAGTGHPGFFNDPITIAGLERAGMTREQAADYANCNCVELTSCGRSFIVSGYNYTNLVKPIEVLLNGGTPMIAEEGWWADWNTVPPGTVALPETYATFDDFFAAYERYLDAVLDAVLRKTDTFQADQDGTCLPLSSSFIAGCIARGEHCSRGGAECMQTFPSFVGLANALDALAAIRQAVFEEQRVTLAELAAACRADFTGAEELHHYLRTACPKYGNDDARTDALAVRIFTRVAERLARARNVYGQAYAPQYFGWITHGARGATTAATPDGRHAGAAVAGTLGGDYGADTHGPTALLRSVTTLDHTRASGGVAVNLSLSPAVVRSDADIDAVLDLLLAYFAMGGMQLQFNYVDAATLCDAQVHPDAHRNLLVRVAGFADRFVALEPNLQAEIISRSRHGVG